jgi:hypothetical protein
MNVPCSRWLRGAWRPLLGALALSSALIGCDKATDPKPVALDELKFAFGLKVVDLGNGTVRLKWTGVNNEEDFSGYNIYGTKESADIAKLEGKAIKLLDDSGDVDASGKAALGKMGYNGTNWETAGAATNNDGDFAVYPYYKIKNGDDAVLPSCFPTATTAGTDGYECSAVTTEGNSGTFNGQTYFDVSGLKIGSNYCFTVLATLDSGKKAAPATSEVRCAVPRASVTPPTALTGESGKHLAMDLAALRTACSSTGGTSCGTFATSLTTGSNQNCDGNQSLCLNNFSNALYFTASGHSGIQDLGYYALGFNDPTFPKIPTITLGTLQNLDGYSLKGQSIPVVKDHIYAVADGEKDNATSFYYHLILVKSVDSATATVEFRIANKIDTP